MGRDPIARALRILRFIGEHDGGPLGVREIASSLGMQPSTVFRTLSQLTAESLVRKEPETSHYTLGLELLRLGQLASAKFNVADVADAHMRSITANSNEAVFLGLYERERQQMFVAKAIPSTHPLRYHIERDRWLDVFRAASGLAILAFLPTEERDGILAKADSVATERTPWLRRERLEETLEEVRQKGYSCTQGWNTPGAVGIAAPVFNGRQVIGDLFMTIPVFRFNENQGDELAQLVVTAAANLTNELGGRPQDS